MAKLVVLDYCTSSVLFIRISDEMVRSLNEDYEGDSETWLSESGLEEAFGFRMSDSNWMISDDDEMEIYDCNPSNKEMVRVFPTY